VRAAVGILQAHGRTRIRWLPLYAISGALACGTHYYGIFLLLAIGFVGFVHGLQRRAWDGLAAWVGIHLLVGLALAPWAPTALAQVRLAASVEEWGGLQPWEALNAWAAALLADGASPWDAGWALMVVVLGTGLGAWRLRDRPLLCALLVSVTVVPLVAALLLAGPVNGFRPRGFLVAVSGPWLLFASAMVADRIRGRFDLLLRLLVAFVTCVALTAGLLYHLDERKEDWRGAARLIASQAEPTDVIFFVHFAGQVAVERYYSGPERRIGLPQSFTWEQGYTARYRVTPEDVERVVLPALEGRQRAWLVLSHDAGRGSEHVTAALDGWGGGPGRAWAFHGVRVLLHQR
jgi:hypothetical protein